MDAQKKIKIQEEFRKHATDTGSVEVQVAMLTERINHLNSHFDTHSHDYASRVGLMRLVGQRRRYLRYLKQRDTVAYQRLITRLGIRG